jgi:hypothetical protein
MSDQLAYDKTAVGLRQKLGRASTKFVRCNPTRWRNRLPSKAVIDILKRLFKHARPPACSVTLYTNQRHPPGDAGRHAVHAYPSLAVPSSPETPAANRVVMNQPKKVLKRMSTARP